MVVQAGAGLEPRVSGPGGRWPDLGSASCVCPFLTRATVLTPRPRVTRRDGTSFTLITPAEGLSAREIAAEVRGRGFWGALVGPGCLLCPPPEALCSLVGSERSSEKQTREQIPPGVFQTLPENRALY